MSICAKSKDGYDMYNQPFGLTKTPELTFSRVFQVKQLSSLLHEASLGFFGFLSKELRYAMPSAVSPAQKCCGTTPSSAWQIAFNTVA